MSRTNQAASQSNSSKEMGPAGCKDVQNVILFAKYKWTTARCSHLIVELKHHSQHACCCCCSWATFCWIVKTFCTHRAAGRSLHNISTQHTTYLLSNVLTITLLLRLPRAGGVPQPQRGGGDGEWQGEQVHGDQRHHRLGAGGGECPPDRDVECPLQPQDIQLLLRGRRGPAQHQVSLDISTIYL